MTALEYAEKAVHHDAAELLRAASVEQRGGPAVELGATELESRAPGPRLRCPECGEPIRLGNLFRIATRVSDGNEPSAYVKDFVRSRVYDALIADHRFHRVLSGKKLRKEITESWAVIRAIHRVIEQCGLGSAVASGPGGITFVDLCCGKSLTSTLLTLLYPAAKVIAIDRLGNVTKSCTVNGCNSACERCAPVRVRVHKATPWRKPSNRQASSLLCLNPLHKPKLTATD